MTQSQIQAPSCNCLRAPPPWFPSCIHNHLFVGKETTTIFLVVGNMYLLIKVSLTEGREYILFTFVCVLLFARSKKTECKICQNLLVSSQRICQENLCFLLSVNRRCGPERSPRHDFFKPHSCPPHSLLPIGHPWP